MFTDGDGEGEGRAKEVVAKGELFVPCETCFQWWSTVVLRRVLYEEGSRFLLGTKARVFEIIRACNVHRVNCASFLFLICRPADHLRASVTSGYEKDGSNRRFRFVY